MVDLGIRIRGIPMDLEVGVFGFHLVVLYSSLSPIGAAFLEFHNVCLRLFLVVFG